MRYTELFEEKTPDLPPTSFGVLAKTSQVTNNVLVARNKGITSLAGMPSSFPNGAVELDKNPLTSLHGCSEDLKLLFVNNCKLSSLDGCPNRLSGISVEGNPIKDFQGISPNVSIINARKCVELTSLRGLPNKLKILDLEDCSALTQFDHTFENLGNVYLNDTGIKDFHGIGHKIKKLDGYFRFGPDVTNLLSLVYIECGPKAEFFSDDGKLNAILNRFRNAGVDGLLELQIELMDSGFDDQAHE